jgi:hypothetical protein
MALMNEGIVTLNGGAITFGSVSGSANGYAYDQEANSINGTPVFTTLEGGIIVDLRNGYYQGAGSLIIPDNQLEQISSLTASGLGTVEIHGGKVAFTSSSGYGSLFLTNSSLLFDGGEYDARINLAAGGQNDLIDVSGTGSTTIQAGSTPKVIGNGTRQSGQTWDIIEDSGGTAIQGDFGTIILPGGVTRSKNAAANLYELQS